MRTKPKRRSGICFCRDELLPIGLFPESKLFSTPQNLVKNQVRETDSARAMACVKLCAEIALYPQEHISTFLKQFTRLLFPQQSNISSDSWFLFEFSSLTIRPEADGVLRIHPAELLVTLVIFHHVTFCSTLRRTTTQCTSPRRRSTCPLRSFARVDHTVWL